MGLISIDNSCNSCGICAQSCPALIIDMSADKNLPFIESSNESRCIACGHCESICPESALLHSLTQQAQASQFEGKAHINPSEIGSYFTNRRSIRKYQQKTVEKNVIEQIMEIVRYAPTGTNRQNNKWVIVSDKKLIEQLAQGTINWMRVLSKANPEMAQRFNASSLISAFEQGNDRICRNAPHIIIGYCDASYLGGIKDVTIAAAHLELLLPSFQLGGCWAGYLMLAMQNYPELKKLVGLDDTSTVHAALMMGYPSFKYYKTPRRNKANIVWL